MRQLSSNMAVSSNLSSFRNICIVIAHVCACSAKGLWAHHDVRAAFLVELATLSLLHQLSKVLHLRRQAVSKA